MGVDRLHGTDDDLVLLPAETVELALALRLAQSLGDDLLGCLGGDATEVMRGDVDQYGIAHLRVGVLKSSLFEGDLRLRILGLLDDRAFQIDACQSCLEADLRGHVLRGWDLPVTSIGGRQGSADSVQHNLSRQAVLCTDLVKGQGELALH